MTGLLRSPSVKSDGQAFAGTFRWGPLVDWVAATRRRCFHELNLAVVSRISHFGVEMTCEYTSDGRNQVPEHGGQVHRRPKDVMNTVRCPKILERNDLLVGFCPELVELE